MFSRHRLAVIAAGVLAAGAAGGAYAATQSSSNPRQAFLDDVARRLDVSPARLRDALQGAIRDERAQHPGWFAGPRRGLGVFHPHGPLTAAARYLGLSDLQLFQQLRSGRSLAQVAKARGRSVSGLEQAMIGELRARLDRAVAAGEIPKAHEQRDLRLLLTRIRHDIQRAPHPMFLPRLRGGPSGPPPPPGGFGPPATPPSAGGPPPGGPPPGGPGAPGI